MAASKTVKAGEPSTPAGATRVALRTGYRKGTKASRLPSAEDDLLCFLLSLRGVLGKMGHAPDGRIIRSINDVLRKAGLDIGL